MRRMKLKPCPLCGGEAHTDRREQCSQCQRPYEPVMVSIYCCKCWLSTGGMPKAKAIRMWNRRTKT